MGVITFFKYVFQLVNTFIDVTNSNDLILSLGLYVIYPAILYLLIDKFHGVCGPEAYLLKAEAIAACNTLFLLFTALLRTSKLIHIIIYSVDADYKSGSQRNLDVEGDDDDDDDDEEVDPRRSNSGGGIGGSGGFCGKLKCQTWMHLSQELTIVGFVAFLLLLCLPVLAFWTMFLHICVSLYSLYSLSKRLWKDAHDSTPRDYPQDGRTDDDGDEGNNKDIEFQQFLSNFQEE